MNFTFMFNDLENKNWVHEFGLILDTLLAIGQCWGGGGADIEGVCIVVSTLCGLERNNFKLLEAVKGVYCTITPVNINL